MRLVIFIIVLIFTIQDLSSQNCDSPQEPWKSLGPIPILKGEVPYQGILVSCEHAEADTSYQQFYAGSNSSGLFYTEDAGYYWKNLTDNAQLPGMGIQDIALCSRDPGYIVLATGMTTYEKDYGQGIVYTLDHGLNWKVVKAINPNSLTYQIARRAVFLKKSFAVLASVEDEIWYCPDIRKEDNWKRLWKAFPERNSPGSYYVHEMKLHPEFPSVPTLYFACSDPLNDQGGSKVYKMDIQDNFKVKELPIEGLEPSQRIDIAVSEAAPERLYCILNRAGSNFELLVSDSLGESWGIRRKLNAYGMGMAGFEIEVSQTDPEVIYYGGISFFKQVGILKGQPNRAQRNIHDDTRDILLLKGSKPGDNGIEDVILNANDGGLSINHKGTREDWKSMVGEGEYGLNISQFYGIALNPIDSNIIAGGLQDNGTIVWNKEKAPKYIYGGDGGDCLYNSEGKMIANYNSGASPGKLFSHEAGKTKLFGKTSFGISNSPLALHSTDPNTVYYGHSQMGQPPIFDVVSLDLATGEIKNLSQKGDKAIRAIAVSEENPNTIYYANLHVSYEGNPEGIVFVSNDAGESWVDISKGLAGSRSMRVSSIAVHPADANIVMVSYAANSIHSKMFISKNGGSSWEDISLGLPESGINRLKYSKHGYAFACTDVGVYVYNPLLSKWQCFSNGLPTVPISDIEFDYCNENVVIASFGRGLWQASYPYVESKDLAPAFLIEKDTIITEDVTFQSDLRVKKGVSVIIKGEPSSETSVILPGNGRLILEKKSSLSLENATISTSCKRGWILEYDFGWLSKKVKADFTKDDPKATPKLLKTDFDVD